MQAPCPGPLDFYSGADCECLGQGMGSPSLDMRTCQRACLNRQREGIQLAICRFCFSRSSAAYPLASEALLGCNVECFTRSNCSDPVAQDPLRFCMPRRGEGGFGHFGSSISYARNAHSLSKFQAGQRHVCPEHVQPLEAHPRQRTGRRGGLF